MPRTILQFIQNVYHSVLSEPTRLRLYATAPNILRKQFDRWSKSLTPPHSIPFSIPTDNDIFYCYRLLLKREPSAQELQNWRDHIDKFGFDLDRLVHELLYSDEYVQKETLLNEPYCVELDSFNLFVRLNDFATSAPIARQRSYEPAVTEQIRRLLSPGKTFVDVGANVGYFSMLAASIVGPSGKVLCFEPNPANCELIHLSIADNKFEGIITCYQTAVGAKEGTLELLLRGTHSNARLLTDQAYKLPSERAITVSVVTLNETLSALTSIDAIKIDVEGAEFMVWEGMQDVVKQHYPTIFFEYFPRSIRTVSRREPLELLRSIINKGYELFLIDDAVGKDPLGPFSPEKITAFQEKYELQLVNLLAIPQKTSLVGVQR